MIVSVKNKIKKNTLTEAEEEDRMSGIEGKRIR
jgi:hypothetical protein